MKKNMGSADRLLRTLAAVGLIIAAATGAIEGTVAIIAAVVAGVFLLTSLVSFCPLYTLIGVTTCKNPQ